MSILIILTDIKTYIVNGKNNWTLFDNVELAKMSFYSFLISKSKNICDLAFTIWRDTYVENVTGYM